MPSFSNKPIQILPCPPDRAAEALALTLRELTPSQRREMAGIFLQNSSLPPYVALSGERLLNTAWGQPQPGNTALFWPPQMAPQEEDAETAHRLTEAVMASIDAAGIEMTQVLLHARDTPEVELLEKAQFWYLADLLYLVWEVPPSPAPRLSPLLSCLQCEAYRESQNSRLMELIEQTYEGTQDCPALNNVRQMQDVLQGYQETGHFNPLMWYFVREGNQDVGVLLLAEHPESLHWELVYMGLVPRARGKQWGKQITQHAQWLAQQAKAQRMVLAVDAANGPALGMYRALGFTPWDRRIAFVRLPKTD